MLFLVILSILLQESNTNSFKPHYHSPLTSYSYQFSTGAMTNLGKIIYCAGSSIPTSTEPKKAVIVAHDISGSLAVPMNVYSNQQDGSYSFVDVVGDYLIAANSSGSLRVYNIITTASFPINVFQFYDGVYLPSQKIYVFTASDYKPSSLYPLTSLTLYYFNFNNPSAGAVSFGTVAANTTLFASSIAFVVCTVGSDGLLMIWNTPNWQMITRYNAGFPIESGCFSSSDSYIILSGSGSIYQLAVVSYTLITLISKFTPSAWSSLSSSSIFESPADNSFYYLSYPTFTQYTASILKGISDNGSLSLSIYNDSSTHSKMKSFLNQTYVIVANDNAEMGLIILKSTSAFLPTCTLLQYLTDNNTCASCSIIPNCLSCLSTKACYSCDTAAGYHLTSGFCCLSNQYYNKSTVMCENCSEDCLACTNSTLCTSCDSLTKLSYNFCCESSKYYNVSTSACQSCSPNCLDCSNSTYCSSCDSLTKISYNFCCVVSQYYNASKSLCESCSPNCLDCVNSTYCTSCDSLTKISYNFCCASSKYYNVSTSVCESCSLNCLDCVNSTYCSSCDSLTKISQNFCCASSKYYNVSTSACESCSPNCLDCVNSTYCTSCDKISQQQNGFCCLISEYFDISTGLCQLCSQNCADCINFTICLTCNAEYSLSYGFCCKQLQQYNTISNQCEFTVQNTFNCENLIVSNGRIICNSMNNPAIKVATKLASASQSAISTPFARQSLQFMSPIFFFNDEYYLYVYHNRNYTNMIVTSTFLYFLTQINNERLISNFVNYSSLQNAINSFANFSNFFTSDYTNYTNDAILSIDENPSYFIQNIYDLIIWNYSLQLIIYLIIVFLAFFVKKIPVKGKNIFWQGIIAIKRFMFRQSHWTALAIGLVEANGIVIVFYGVQQLRQSFYFNFADKVNTILALTFFFTCLIYGFCFYSLLLRYSRNIGCMLLECRKSSKFNYCYQASFEIFKNILMGAIHSYLLTEYIIQIVSLFLLRLALMIGTIASRRIFQSKVDFIFKITYIAFGMMFDIVLLLSYLIYENGLSQYSNYFFHHSYAELVILCGIIFTIMLYIVVQLFLTIGEFICKNAKKSNGVKTLELRSNKVDDLSKLKKYAKKVLDIRLSRTLPKPKEAKKLKVKKLLRMQQSSQPQTPMIIHVKQYKQSSLGRPSHLKKHFRRSQLLKKNEEIALKVQIVKKQDNQSPKNNKSNFYRHSRQY